ncbi:MAG: AI-2E family transporter [Prevotellaceae bacterium]|jgi:predicted PurR-regulated permease PerM|nr:AI-2E family transporter [Prevotellaceae bacterium]
MNKLARYIIITAVVTLVAFLAWYFSNIVTYLLIAAVFSIIGKPLMQALGKVRIRNCKLPRILCAAITLVTIWGVFFSILFFLLPAVVNLVNQLSHIDIHRALQDMEQSLDAAQAWITQNIPGVDAGFSLRDTIAAGLTDLFSNTALLNLFGSVTNTIVGFVVGACIVSFITFFFLKEENLFTQGVLLLFPAKHEKNAAVALDSINQLLSRYFIGLCIDMLCVAFLVTLGLTLVAGLPFRIAVVLGSLSGILNVIPYIGSITSALTGILIGVLMNINAPGGHTSGLWIVITTMACVYIGAQTVDAAVLQPFIYSKSVRTHPLEIFLVILIAGSIGGILGMLVAIPAYTVARVFAKQFFNQFRVVQKLTEKI